MMGCTPWQESGTTDISRRQSSQLMLFLPEFEGLIFVFRVEIQRIVYTNASRRDLKDSQAVVILRISCP